jgi:predicted HTH domain antitoxin
MSTIALSLEDELTALLRQTNQPIELAVRELIVLELYRRGVVSSGKAGQLLGMSRWDFIRHAARLGIPYLDMTEDEWEEERQQSLSAAPERR